MQVRLSMCMELRSDDYGSRLTAPHYTIRSSGRGTNGKQGRGQARFDAALQYATGGPKQERPF